MKKLFSGILLLVIIALVIYNLKPSSNNLPTSDKPTIKIGVSFPLTGDLAYAGEGMKAS